MKTAFSTLGCPQWSFAEIFSTAKDLGFDGIEFRGVGNQIYTPDVREFTSEKIDETIKKFKTAKISVPVFSSGAVMTDGNSAVNEAKGYIDLAARFGTPYVRVLADRNPAPSEKIDETTLISNLCSVCLYAREKNVSILIETNGAYSKSESILALIKKTGMDNLFIIWDLHHTVRYGGEKPQDTAKALAQYIRHVHLKDSKITGGKLEYKMPGDGDIPIKEAVSALKGIGYNGFLCLEWVKRWSKDLAEPGIVFPSFLYYIRNVICG